MDSFKTWLVEVVLKNVGPKVSASVLSALVALMAAHQGLMEQMGITYYPNFNGTWSGVAPTGSLLTVEIDTLGKWGALALIGLMTAGVAFFQHHTAAAVTGAPQSGNSRATPAVDVPGGNRQTDPPAAV